MKGYVKDETGAWFETFTMQNVIDNNFQDGLDWNTFTASYNGRNSPLLPLTNSHFHTTTQLRFTFTSDSVDNDIGYWIDELVIIYDQAAKKKEFQIETNGVSTIGGLPGRRLVNNSIRNDKHRKYICKIYTFGKWNTGKLEPLFCLSDWCKYRFLGC